MVEVSGLEPPASSLRILRATARRPAMMKNSLCFSRDSVSRTVLHLPMFSSLVCQLRVTVDQHAQCRPAICGAIDTSPCVVRRAKKLAPLANPSPILGGGLYRELDDFEERPSGASTSTEALPRT